MPETVKFTLKPDGSYRCNREGDHSGVYLSSAQYEGSVAKLRNLRAKSAQLLEALTPEDEAGAKSIQRLRDLVEETAHE